MIECKIDENGAKTSCCGTALTLAAEIVVLVNDLYRMMHGASPAAAHGFKQIMQHAMSDDSPAWKLQEGTKCE